MSTPILSSGTVDPALLGLPEQRRDRLTAGFVSSLVGLAFDVPATEMFAERSSNAATRARQIAMYLVHIAFAWSTERVGAAFRRAPSTVAHACRRVEQLRDDPALDDQLSALEACLDHAPGRAA